MPPSAASNAAPAATRSAPVIPFAAYRRNRRAKRRLPLKLVLGSALLILGLIGSFADSVLVRTSLFFIASPADGGSTGVHSLAAALICATIANLAACGGVFVILYWLWSRPSATVVRLDHDRIGRNLRRRSADP